MANISGDIGLIANSVLNEGYQMTLQNGLECRISKLCATKLPKMIEKEIRNQHQKSLQTRWMAIAQSEINLMQHHYFPKCVAVVFTKRATAASKGNRLRFGLVIDLRESLFHLDQSPENLHP